MESEKLKRAREYLAQGRPLQNAATAIQVTPEHLDLTLWNNLGGHYPGAFRRQSPRRPIPITSWRPDHA